MIRNKTAKPDCLIIVLSKRILFLADLEPYIRILIGLNGYMI